MAAIEAGEATEARVRIQYVLKPNNNHLNNDTLQYPPFLKPADVHSTHLGYTLDINKSLTPPEGQTVFKVLSREVKDSEYSIPAREVKDCVFSPIPSGPHQTGIIGYPSETIQGCPGIPA